MTDFICDVAETYRSACEGLPCYAEHLGKQYCVLHFPGEGKQVAFQKMMKDKLAQHDFDFKGVVFPEGTADFVQFEFDTNTSFAGATFVGNAHFRDAKFSGRRADFSGAVFRGQRTNFAGASFSGLWTLFKETEFSGQRISFDGTMFRSKWTGFFAAHFGGKETDFSRAKFVGSDTYFSEAQFSSDQTYFSYVWFGAKWKTDFSEAEFRSGQTSFIDAHFASEDTDFSSAEFSSNDTSFANASFANDVSYVRAVFKERINFLGTNRNLVFNSQGSVQFHEVRIDKPELLTFNSVLLHPGWFVESDIRRVGFTDVKWYGMRGGPKGTLDEEIDALKERHGKSSHTLLAQVCRRLSTNAEENREYPLANEFHYWSMDVLRKEDWSFYTNLTWRDLLRWETWPAIMKHFGLITTLYWAFSGYGVTAARAFWVLVLTWFVFAASYLVLRPSPFWVSASDIWEVLDNVREAAVYSLSALVRLNPRPQSEGLDWFQTLEAVREGRLTGLDQQHSRFLESLYVLTSASVSQRSLRPRMGNPRPTDSARQAWWSSAQVAGAGHPQCRLLRLEKRLPVAHASARVPSMVYGPSLLQALALGRYLGEDQHSVARKYPPTCGSRSPTERRYPRHPISEDHQRRRGAWLRRSQETQRKKAAFAGGYAGYGAQSQGACGGPTRSCGGAAGT